MQNLNGIDWISVKKELPDENADILIACDWFDVGMSAWFENGKFFFLDGEEAHSVTHWMRAPKTP